ncbi:hypothetical protein [Marinomonas gallaica]|uniref:hypothetical protein n=1 Tax=Marinomonas gallaica TaxID=1806667 RepID=UPI003A8EDABE
MYKIVSRWLGDGFIVAAIPFFGYAIALSHEYGYATYFGYPTSMISITLEMTLKSSVWAVVYFFAFYNFVASLILFSNVSTIKGVLARNILYFSIFPAIGVFATGFSGLFIKFFFASVIISIAFTLLVSLSAKGTGSLRESIIKGNSDVFSYGSGNAEDEHTAQANLKLMLFGSLVLIVICMGAGSLSAKSKNDYYVFEHTKSSYVLIATYGDRVIAAPYDQKKHDYIKEFSVFDLSSGGISKLMRVEL